MDEDDKVTPSRVRHTEDEFRYSTPQAAAAVRWLRTLPDVAVLSAARSTTDLTFRSDSLRSMLEHLGDVNPSWVTARCAEVAYERGLIDEVDFDQLTR